MDEGYWPGIVYPWQNQYMQTLSLVSLRGVDDVAILEEWILRFGNHGSNNTDAFVVDRDDPNGMFVTSGEIEQFDLAVSNILRDLGITASKASTQHMNPVIADGLSVSDARSQAKQLLAFAKTANVVDSGGGEGGLPAKFGRAVTSLKPSGALEWIGSLASVGATGFGLYKRNKAIRNTGIVMSIVYVGYKLSR